MFMSLFTCVNYAVHAPKTIILKHRSREFPKYHKYPHKRKAEKHIGDRSPSLINLCLFYLLVSGVVKTRWFSVTLCQSSDVIFESFDNFLFVMQAVYLTSFADSFCVGYLENGIAHSKLSPFPN